MSRYQNLKQSCCVSLPTAHDQLVTMRKCLCSIRKGHETGKVQLDTDMTKQLLSSKSVARKLMSADLPVYLHFGWHMTCEEINRIARLPLKVWSSSVLRVRS